ncbi:hypothetical protein AVEN_100170-1 [Araneus ventricosus]|uniref:C2H2-type domain-containing protein n=1 Tax=Araneus ventricosus TaxID=182803 RepID=A0A4Y2QWK2_ARAVE|nr:hypothetical protein AVEN_100170-1 [Araneus ventricosus]
MTTENTTDPEVTAAGRDLSSFSGQGADAASTTVPVDPAFQCPDCTRLFTTKTGLGVHSRSQHPQQCHERALLKTRTLEDIKGKRRALNYRKLVEEKIEFLRTVLSAIPSAAPPSVAVASSYDSSSNDNIEENPDPAIVSEPGIIALFSIDTDRNPEEFGQVPDDISRATDPVRDPSLVGGDSVPEAAGSQATSVEDVWHMAEDTLIQGTLEYYVDDLNSDFGLMPRPSPEETAVLDLLLDL